jgi:hypothetical protein
MAKKRKTDKTTKKFMGTMDKVVRHSGNKGLLDSYFGSGAKHSKKG